MHLLGLFLYRAWAWLRWQRKAVGPRSVHSPFVYGLLTTVLSRGKSHTSAAKDKLPQWLLEYRKKIRNDTTILELKDVGAGTLDAPRSNRSVQVRQVARRSGASLHKLLILKRLAEEHQPNSAIEFGTNLGLSACAITAGGGHFETIEAAENLCAYVEHQQQLAWTQDQNIDQFLFTVIQATFQDYRKKNEHTRVYDFAYLDGDHTECATISNGNWLLDRLLPGGLLIVDDLYWSLGMERAWHQLCKHPSVTVSIDLFHLGLLYVNRPQAREHFVLRF
jgi:predicted O-methyltransferase YrrM